MVENKLGYSIQGPPSVVKGCSRLSCLSKSNVWRRNSWRHEGVHLEAPKQSLEWTQILKCFKVQTWAWI